MNAPRNLNYKLLTMGGWNRSGSLVFGTTMAVVLFGAISAVAGWWNQGGWIDRYQSLIGGILALIGAAATVWYLRRQIHEADRATRLAGRRDTAGLNIPLIARLDALIEEYRSIEELVADLREGGEKGSLDIFFALDTRLGSQLSLIDALWNSRLAAVNTCSLILAAASAWDRTHDEENGKYLDELGVGLLIAINEVQDVAKVAARQLSYGRSPIELAHWSAEDLRFRAPPTD